MKLGEIIKSARNALLIGGISDSHLEADVLVTHILSIERADIYSKLDEDFPLTTEHLKEIIDRRLGKEPLFYILGHREFYGIRIKVDHNVLIPRQETELLVDKAISLGSNLDRQMLTIADIGTGSGAICIAIALNLPNANFIATDISVDALNVAQENIRRYKLEDRISLIQGNLLEPLAMKVDIIVSNLPYIPSKLLKTLEPEILREPKIALDGGPDGLTFINNILKESPLYLNPGGVILLEIDPDQNDRLTALSKEIYPDCNVWTEKDLLGLDRLIIMQECGSRCLSQP